MSKNPPSVEQRLRELQHEYVASTGVRGGTSRDFVQWLVSQGYAEQLTDLHRAELLAPAAKRVWRTSRDARLEDEQGNLLLAVGEPLPSQLTIFGEGNEANYRRVATDQALLNHKIQDTAIKRRKVEEALLRTTKEEERDEVLIERSGNDLTVPLVELLD